MGLHEDIVSAQQVVSRAVSNINNKDNFHNTSAIYKISNERIQDYQKYLSNRKRILSVIASADQILCSILDGTKEVDAFDISVYPKYYMFLKMAGIKALSREEYIDFFYESADTSERYDDIYDRIRVYLKGGALEFWDSLFGFFDWYDIFNSTLFSSEPYVTSTAVNQNRFLQNDEDYNKLRRVIDDVVIRTYEGDILDIADGFTERYDLIYLSNIIYYSDVNRYREMLKKFHLEDDGVILSYFYSISDNVRGILENDNNKFEAIGEGSAQIMLTHKS